MKGLMRLSLILLIAFACMLTACHNSGDKQADETGSGSPTSKAVTDTGDTALDETNDTSSDKSATVSSGKSSKTQSTNNDNKTTDSVTSSTVSGGSSNNSSDSTYHEELDGEEITDYGDIYLPEVP